MMGGGTFIPLNAGRPWPESAKQTEIRLAILLKMLQIAHFGTAALARGEKDIRRSYSPLFPRVWLIHPELFFRCDLVHSFPPGNWCSIAQARLGNKIRQV